MITKQISYFKIYFIFIFKTVNVIKAVINSNKNSKYIPVDLTYIGT